MRLKDLKRFFSGAKSNPELLDFWPCDPESLWLLQLFRALGFSPTAPTLVHSVFGDSAGSWIYRGHKKIFFSGENLQNSYQGYLSNVHTSDLSLSFEPDNGRNIYFPLWIWYHFPYSADPEAVRSVLRRWSTLPPRPDAEFCALIARHDQDGHRAWGKQKLDLISEVMCGKALFHNDDRLKTQFSNDKKLYLQQFKFNFCPENSDTLGYVTEKLFDAVDAGCLPIYRGSLSRLDPRVINSQRVIFTSDPSFLSLVEDLHSHPQRYIEFFNQPCMLPTAADFVIERFDLLRTRLAELAAQS